MVKETDVILETRTEARRASAAWPVALLLAAVLPACVDMEDEIPELPPEPAGTQPFPNSDRIYDGDIDTMPSNSGSGTLEANGNAIGVPANGEDTPTGGTGGTNDGSRLIPAQALSSNLTAISNASSWDAALAWCNHPGAKLFIGDFNGDNRSDMLCHDGAGSKWVALANVAGQFTGTSWSAPLAWCNHAGAQLFIGDFNGDNRDDILCHDGAGSKWVALANVAGQFTGTSWTAPLAWCNHPGAKLFIGDFNGDNRDDMLCHDGAGSKWVALANVAGQFTGTSWTAPLAWCNHSGARLFVGDFNGDNRDDMLCHDGAGSKWVALANVAGQFTGTSWTAPLAWCNHSGAQLFMGDFNGDNRGDMMCHDGAGSKWIALATVAGQFTGTSWYAPMSWCNHSGAQLFIGDYNGDNRDDMLCHDSTGHKWIANALPGGSF